MGGRKGGRERGREKGREGKGEGEREGDFLHQKIKANLKVALLDFGSTFTGLSCEKHLIHNTHHTTFICFRGH